MEPLFTNFRILFLQYSNAGLQPPLALLLLQVSKQLLEQIHCGTSPIIGAEAQWGKLLQPRTECPCRRGSAVAALYSAAWCSARQSRTSRFWLKLLGAEPNVDLLRQITIRILPQQNLRRERVRVYPLQLSVSEQRTCTKTQQECHMCVWTRSPRANDTVTSCLRMMDFHHALRHYE